MLSGSKALANDPAHPDIISFALCANTRKKLHILDRVMLQRSLNTVKRQYYGAFINSHDLLFSIHVFALAERAKSLEWLICDRR